MPREARHRYFEQSHQGKDMPSLPEPKERDAQTALIVLLNATKLGSAPVCDSLPGRLDLAGGARLATHQTERTPRCGRGNCMHPMSLRVWQPSLE